MQEARRYGTVFDVKTVGLYEVDSRIYYIDQTVVVIDNPDNLIPTIIVRKNIDGCDIITKDMLMMKVRKIVKDLGMKLVGEPYYRSDGLWSQELEVKDGEGKR